MKKIYSLFVLLVSSVACAAVPPNLGGTISAVVDPMYYSNTTHILGMPAATTSQSGFLTSTDWNTFNNKAPAITPGSISTSTTGVTIGSGANSTVGPNVTVNVQTASGSQPGLLSAADWNTFNGKQNALTIGDLTDDGTDGITVTGGVGAVIGSGTQLTQHVADATHNGYLALADFNRFSIDQMSGELEVAYNKTYTLSLAIPYSGVINTLKIQTTSGTCTAAIHINGTPVTGISAVSVSSVLSTATASAANTFSANDKITLVITSASLANDLVYTLKVTKQ